MTGYWGGPGRLHFVGWGGVIWGGVNLYKDGRMKHGRMRVGAFCGLFAGAVLGCGVAAAQSSAPGTVFRDAMASGGQGPEMVVLPTGQFRMGDLSGNGERDEQPTREVIIDYPLAMMKHEVTRRAFRAFVEATGYRTDAEQNADGKQGCFIYTVRADGQARSEWTAGQNWRNAEMLGERQAHDRHPVVCISRADAEEYADWLSEQTGQDYRLPSEAEWEYAARAGTPSPWYFSSVSGTKQCGYANGADETELPGGWGWEAPVPCRDGYAYTAPVGAYLANDFGLHDMLGNVSEWVLDCYNDHYRRAPSDGGARRRCDSPLYILRGGSWFDSPQWLRAANRIRQTPSNRDGTFGFRLAREVAP